MARDEDLNLLPRCLADPQISLTGVVGKEMLDAFRSQLAEARTKDEDIALEITTPGGDAELGRRLVLDIEDMRARTPNRFLFLGKTQIYSAGTTIMSAFPREDRYLSRDAVLMIHCRQLETCIEISGPVRASLPKIEAARQQIEMGIRLEEENFRQMIAGSDIGLDELFERALHNWYLTAEEAVKRGLVARVVDTRPSGNIPVTRPMRGH